MLKFRTPDAPKETMMRLQAESSARLAAYEEAQRQEQTRKAQSQKEQEDFMQRVYASRQLVSDALAAGLVPEITIPSLHATFTERRLIEEERVRQAALEVHNSEYALSTAGMPLPPRQRAAAKAAYFEQLNAAAGYPDPVIQ